MEIIASIEVPIKLWIYILVVQDPKVHQASECLWVIHAEQSPSQQYMPLESLHSLIPQFKHQNVIPEMVEDIGSLQPRCAF
jgi:hypothetical protein